LLLGVGLVAASVAILAGGTLYGLASYVSTMNTVDSKLAELLLLDGLKVELASLSTTIPGEAPLEAPAARKTIEASRGRFRLWQDRFVDTVRRGRDPDPYQDARLAQDIEESFVKLELAVGGNLQASIEGKPLVEDDRWIHSLRRLGAQVDELRHEIARDMFKKVDDARRHYKRSVWVLGSATGLSAALVLMLMYLFSGWLFRPIRELQKGVQRVAAGDFSHPIALKTRDELEDLAVAFNTTMKKLHDNQRDLERQVNERSRQLVRSERLVSVGFLAAGVAHEINNPLASIAFCAESLQTRLTDYVARHPQDGEVVGRYLQMIQQEAFRCKKITARLLDFSRVGDRRREQTDLGELVQSVLEMSQHLQNCRGKRILFHPVGKVSAWINSQDIKSVVLNLVVNALDSMDEGGTVNITLQQLGATAELAIADGGCGMSAEVLENIFEPFYTRSRTGRGTGLGLFISHQIVDQHGGEIKATSAGTGMGSTFMVRFPLSAPQTQDAGESGADAGVLAFSRPRSPLFGKNQEDGLGHAA